MNHKLLTDIELDVQELKCLMKSFNEEPTSTLKDLLKRNIAQMQERLEDLVKNIEETQTSIPNISVEQLSESEATNKLNETEPSIEIINPDEQQLVSEQTKDDSHTENGNNSIDTIDNTPHTNIIQPIKEEPINVTIGNSEKEEAVILAESLKIYSGNLRHFISLNDSFRFSRDLFGGDNELMNRVLEQISAMDSYKAAVAFALSKINVSDEDETFNDFLELLKKYFNQSV